MAILRIEIDLDAIDGNTVMVQQLLMQEVKNFDRYRHKKLTEYETAEDPEPFMVEAKAQFKDGTTKVIGRTEVDLMAEFDNRQQIEHIAEQSQSVMRAPSNSRMKTFKGDELPS